MSTGAVAVDGTAAAGAMLGAASAEGVGWFSCPATAGAFTKIHPDSHFHSHTHAHQSPGQTVTRVNRHSTKSDLPVGASSEAGNGISSALPVTKSTA
jgi:hypothetical protein